MSTASGRRTRRARGAGRITVGRWALKVVVYAAFAYLVVRLLPDLEKALQSLERVRWQWVAGAIALEVLSEVGFVESWRGIVDPDGLLAGDGRGPRIDRRAAWAQLGGAALVPGGSLAGIGVGAWILRRLGMPAKTIAERQFNLSFLNTAVAALALVVCGVGLGVGVFAGESNPLLTWVPAAAAAVGAAAALLIARRGARSVPALTARHAKLGASVESLSTAVEATDQILFHRRSRRSVLGALAYLAFNVLVLWSAFLAIHAHPMPGLAIVVMAYIIGALGGSIPLPAGIGAVGGIVGMLILYGVARSEAIAAVVLYEAVGLIVPVLGGGVAYLLLRRQFGPMKTAKDAAGQ